MNELIEILNLIEEIYYKVEDNEKKHKLLSQLWTNYYKESKEKNITLDKAYELYLLGENESYVINQKPERLIIKKEELESSLDSIYAYFRGIKKGISRNEARILLDWTVENTRKNFENLCINVENSSLNGFCEIGQVISIMPFENLGLKVTKNTSNYCFEYPFNHAFGTVTFPIYENGKLMEETYLIDTTYRQFFTTVRCNEGRYYTKDENLNIATAPDPGYFVSDIDFSKELMKKGYVKLDNKTASLYGEPFYKSSLIKENINKISNINYYENITKQKGNYLASSSDLEGLNINFILEKSLAK